MDKERILEAVKNLPLTEIEKVPEDGDIWTHEEDGCDMMMTKHNHPDQGGPDMYSLALKGENIAQKAIDFVKAIGVPDSTHVDESGIVLLTWVAGDIKI